MRVAQGPKLAGYITCLLCDMYAYSCLLVLGAAFYEHIRNLQNLEILCFCSLRPYTCVPVPVGVFVHLAPIPLYVRDRGVNVTH